MGPSVPAGLAVWRRRCALVERQQTGHDLEANRPPRGDARDAVLWHVARDVRVPYGEWRLISLVLVHDRV